MTGHPKLTPLIQQYILQMGSLVFAGDSAQLDMSFGVFTVDEQRVYNEIPTSAGLETGISNATANTPLRTDSRRAPHRAWEEGYRSPFSQTYPNRMNPQDNEHSSIRSRGARFSFASENLLIREPSLPVLSAHSNLPGAVVNRSTSLRYSTAVPPSQRDTYRPRMRRVTTKEVTLEDIDISALVTLGMSPFMTGQDVIANQNRLIRNECIFARHFVRIQRVTTESDARHAKIARDIYEHLEQHRLALNHLKLGSGAIDATAVSNNMGTHPLRVDPEFIALEKAHEETRTRLQELSQRVAESSESTQRALMDLAQRLDQLLAKSKAAT